MALDVLGHRFGVGIVPRCVVVDLRAYHHIVVARRALPGADCVGLAGAEELRIQRVSGEV